MTEQNKNISEAMRKIKKLYERKHLPAWIESATLRIILKELIQKGKGIKK